MTYSTSSAVQPFRRSPQRSVWVVLETTSSCCVKVVLRSWMQRKEEPEVLGKSSTLQAMTYLWSCNSASHRQL